MAEQKMETVEKVEEKTVDKKEQPAEKIEADKKAKKVVKVKKEEAVARGEGLHVSLKHAMAVSRFIKNKNIDVAIIQLGEVIAMKKAIPFKGEIPHRKGEMMSGRYPVNACKEFIPILKGLRGNVIANSMELEKTVISYSCPSWGSRPMRTGGRKGKRINIIIKAKEKKENGRA